MNGQNHSQYGNARPGISGATRKYLNTVSIVATQADPVATSLRMDNKYGKQPIETV